MNRGRTLSSFCRRSRPLTPQTRLKLRAYRIACGLWTGLLLPPSSHPKGSIQPLLYPEAKP